MVHSYDMLSTRLMGMLLRAPPQETDATLCNVLTELGTDLKCKAFLVLQDGEGFASHGSVCPEDAIARFITPWEKTLSQGSVVHAEDTAAKGDRDHKRPLLVPVVIQNELVGVLALLGAEFPQDCTGALSAVAEGMVNAWTRSKASEQEPHDAMRPPSAELLQALETIDDAFALFDKNDRLVMCNERYREIYSLTAPAMKPGVSFEEIERYAVQHGQLTDANGREDEWIKERLWDRKHAKKDTVQTLSNGRITRVRERRTVDGGLIAVHTDITEMREAEERFENVITGARVGSWELDVPTGKNTINQRWAEILGYSLHELEPSTMLGFWDLCHEDDRDRVKAALDKCIKGEANDFTLDFRMRHKFGHWTWIQSRGQVLRRDAQGKALLLAGIHLDVSAERAARDRLERREALFRHIYDIAPSGIMQLDFESGAILHSNATMEQITGHSRDELRRMSFTDLMAETDDMPPVRHFILEMRETGGFAPIEVKYRHKSGAHVPVEVRGAVGEDPRGRKTVWCFVIDLSDRIERERERMAAAESARAAHETLTTAIEALPDGFVLVDADDRLVLFNSTYRDLYPEISNEISVGRKISDIQRAGIEHGIYADADYDAQAWLDEMRADAENEKRDTLLHLADGRTIRLLEQTTPNGGRVGLRIDVTEIVEAERRLADIISGAQVGTFQADLRNGTNNINDRWANMIGYDRAELEPMTLSRFRDFVHPDDVEKLAQEDTHLTEGRRVFENELRLRHKDGHYIWVLSRGRVTRRAPDGRALMMSGVHINISEQKAREAAIAEAKAELEATIEERDLAEQRFYDISSVSNNWYWEQGPDLRFTFISESVRGATGAEPEVFYGKTRNEVVSVNPAAVAAADWDSLNKTIEAREPFRDFTYLMPKQGSGGDRWFRISGAPVFDNDGEFTGYRGVGADVTELVEATERAEAANQAKSQFLANMSHEIRTPLNGVLGMAELLESSITDPEQHRMIALIRQSGEALLNILNDLLDMSKIEAGRLELEYAPFRVDNLARRLEDIHTLKADEKGLTLDVLIGSGSELPRIGDSHRVQQILHNLLSNAIKFTETGGITLTVSGRAGRPLKITVSDTGIGMTDEQAARLFEDFTQADSSITRRFGGTGLGMSIVRQLVLLMEGDIKVQSHPGEGTTITVELPLDIATQELEPSPGLANDEACSFEGRRILAADDNAANREILSAMLKRLGVNATIVTDGQEAINEARSSDYDLILLDISMPVKDGMTALHEIRDIEEAAGKPPTPIIAVTANAMAHQIAEYVIAGFDSHVPKPFGLKDLKQALSALLAT
ncbi:MAG: PAS domain S-box protein [Sediminimonas qiaohouensis]|uniref:Sensory/regulatory protein RpfC n=1 Tax=Sediminimonas qiaohouensis TaxID=552061 RepID=A0A7C9HAX1_9RHOB|nr:PAS domain-containing protein [Sediminimonas qiaohouensis]MTJ04524.1 PAS domain S-box protein [Sediminimonas qiaohouensis]